MKVLSIIIPTYNMEQYIRRCLDSLLLTEGFEELEVLVINDGSKDMSSVIAHEYEKRYPNTFRVIDKSNGNYGSCINRGMREATGKYVKILDSDDYFSRDALKEYIKILSSNDADLFITNYNHVDNKQRVFLKRRFQYPRNTILDVDKYCTTKNFISIQMYAITYRTEMIKKIFYQQSEGISYTDQEWIFEPMSQVKKFYFSDLIIYNYLRGRSGQTMSKEQLKLNFSHNIKVFFVMLDAYNRRSDECNKAMREYLKAKLITRINFIYNSAFFRRYITMESLIKIDNQIKEKNLDIWKSLNTLPVKPYFPVCLIKYWRIHKMEKIPFYIRLISKYIFK